MREKERTQYICLWKQVNLMFNKIVQAKPFARITHSAFIFSTPPLQKSSRTECGTRFLRLNDHRAPSITPCGTVHLKLMENLTVASSDSEQRQRGSEVMGNEGCWRLIDFGQRVCMSTNTHLWCLHLFTLLSKFCFCNVVISVLSGRFHPEEWDSLTQWEPSQHVLFPIMAGQSFPIINHFLSLYLGWGVESLFRGLLWLRDEWSQI